MLIAEVGSALHDSGDDEADFNVLMLGTTSCVPLEAALIDCFANACFFSFPACKCLNLCNYLASTDTRADIPETFFLFQRATRLIVKGESISIHLRARSPQLKLVH